MDSQSTLAAGGRLSMPAATAEEMQGPEWGLERVVSEGYFCLLPQKADYPGLEMVEQAHDAEGLSDWLMETFAWNPHGIPEVPYNRVLKKMNVSAFERDFYVKPAVEAATAAWQAVVDFTSLQDKTRKMEAQINHQADTMIAKLRATSANTRKIQATEEWRVNKLLEVKGDLTSKEAAGMRVVNAAAAPLIAVWKRCKDDFLRRRSLSSAAPSQLSGPAESSYSEEFDQQALVRELEQGMGSLQLAATFPGIGIQGCQCYPCIHANV